MAAKISNWLGTRSQRSHLSAALLEGFLRLPNHDFAAFSPINFAGSSPPQQNWVISPAEAEEPIWPAL